MDSFALSKFSKLFFFSLFCVFLFLLVNTFMGNKVSKETAAAICAKILTTYNNEKFEIVRVDHSFFHSFSHLKVSIYSNYITNNKVFSSDCIIKKRYYNIIKVDKAFIIGSSGQLTVIEKLELSYNN